MLPVNQIVLGHILPYLQSLPDASVHCVVTSPPYWGLRDYGLEPVLWDGEPDCEHDWGDELVKKTSSTYNKDFNERSGNAPGQRKQEASSYGQISQGRFCKKCQLWHGNYGLEPTPELYIRHTVEIFREIRRVLRPDGTLWLNMGDSYATGGGNGTAA